MRFALLEMKLTLAKILKNYTIEPTANTHGKEEYQNLYVESLVTRKIKSPLKVVFKRRVLDENK
jgi:hypothetical protein